MKKVDIGEKKNSGVWMQTYTSRKFDLIHIDPEDINIVDIAHSLSGINRFNGHLKKQISVAQHSLTVAAAMRKDGVSKKIALEGLMHDSHEAYTGDVIHPVKIMLKYRYGIDWDEIEEPFKIAISEKFDIDILNPDKLVLEYDEAVLRSEAEDQFDRIVDDWTSGIKNRLKDRVTKILKPHESYELFVATFKRLGGKL